MNCRPGDLAVMIHGPKNAGLIVRVVCLLTKGEIIKATCGASVRVLTANTWLLEQAILRNCSDGVPRYSPCARDDEMRPIRDPGDDARDEMLRPLPEEVTT